jgi:multiple sugar transport system permease protein
MKRRRRLGRVLSYIFLSVSSLIMIYPVLYMALGTFTTPERFIETVVLPLPNTLNLALFRHAFAAGIGDAYRLTLIRCAFYITVTLVVGLTAGYVLSKLNFPGKNKVFLLFLSGMVMPSVLMIVPMFLQMAWWPLAGGNNILGQGGHGFIGNWPVLFVYGWVPPLAIFLFRQSYDMIPREYEDAARVDGAGMYTIITRIYLPLLRPPIAALTIITFLGMWNDFLWPSVALFDNEQYYPIAVRAPGIYIGQLSGGLDWNIFYPGGMLRSFVVLCPPAIVYFLLQRYFVQGLVTSGLKG